MLVCLSLGTLNAKNISLVKFSQIFFVCFDHTLRREIVFIQCAKWASPKMYINHGNLLFSYHPLPQVDFEGYVRYEGRKRIFSQEEMIFDLGACSHELRAHLQILSL